MEVDQVLGTMSCHTGKSLGSWPHHGPGITTSTAPKVGRWHLDVPGENCSPAENCTYVFLWLGMTFIPSMRFLLSKEDLNLVDYTLETI